MQKLLAELEAARSKRSGGRADAAEQQQALAVASQAADALQLRRDNDPSDADRRSAR